MVRCQFGCNLRLFFSTSKPSILSIPIEGIVKRFGNRAEMDSQLACGFVLLEPVSLPLKHDVFYER
jgi:hypothetical protein